MIELTPQQHEIVTRDGTEPVRVMDRATNTQYVLVPIHLYERLQALWDDELPDAASLINEVMAEDDLNDPYLESYQQMAREQ